MTPRTASALEAYRNHVRAVLNNEPHWGRAGTTLALHAFRTWLKLRHPEDVAKDIYTEAIASLPKDRSARSVWLFQ